MTLGLRGALDAPVTLARRLRALGLSLASAHDAVTRLAAGERLSLALPVPRAKVMAALGGFPLEFWMPQVPARADVKALRRRLGLSQQAFASRFALSLHSVRNWEQGRSAPDGNVRAYLVAIARDPEAVFRMVNREVQPAASRAR